MCEALDLELYNIRYYPSFSFFGSCVWYSPESSNSMHHYTMSFKDCIALFAESINKAHLATNTVTIVLKNVVQPCRWPFTQGWFFFWTHRRGQKMSSAPGFPIWLGSLPRLKIRRGLESVLTLVSRYTLLFFILTKCFQSLYRFCLCSGMWPESISLNHQQIH